MVSPHFRYKHLSGICVSKPGFSQSMLTAEIQIQQVCDWSTCNCASVLGDSGEDVSDLDTVVSIQFFSVN